jgi:hypothetical protein
MLSFQIGQQCDKVFFEYTSKGTYSQMEIHVEVSTDRKVSYKRSHIRSDKVYEEWTGHIEETDYNLFVNEIIETCNFMKLPENIEKPLNIKDSSTDKIVVNYNSKTHSIGGYGASHYKKYHCVYKTYNKMMLSVRDKEFQIRKK